MDKYEKKETLGQGQFGIVFKAVHKEVRSSDQATAPSELVSSLKAFSSMSCTENILHAERSSCGNQEN